MVRDNIEDWKYLLNVLQQVDLVPKNNNKVLFLPVIDEQNTEHLSTPNTQPLSSPLIIVTATLSHLDTYHSICCLLHLLCWNGRREAKSPSRKAFREPTTATITSVKNNNFWRWNTEEVQVKCSWPQEVN